MHMAPETEDTLRADDTSSFEDFYEAAYPRLVRLMYAMTTDLPEAEEVAQDAMFRVYQRWGDVSAMHSPEGYAYRTALNLERKRLRHLQVRARRLLHLKTAAPMEPHVPGEVVSSLAGLPAGQRAALLLVEWIGLSPQEAASVLGITAPSVRSRIHRAKASLRATLRSDDDG
jgi:RNA polymerase sigma-70 factor (ECF subfamily)